MKSLPSGWAKTALGEIADVQLGKMLDQAKNIGKPYLYLRNVNVRWGKFDLTDVQSMKITSDEVALFNVQNGDVFVCEGGEPGRCAVWNHGTNEFTYQKALHRVRFRGELNPKLFAWQMLLDAQSQKLTNYFTGSTIKHFPKTEIVKYPVLIPPLKEQTRIADKLDTVLTRVDACRDRLARVAPLLKRFRQSVLAAATSGRLTEKWRSTHQNDSIWPITDLASVAEDFSYGSGAKSSAEGSTPVLRMGNIQGGKLDWQDLVYTSDPTEIKKYTLIPGDVLFNRTNSPELVGKTAVYKGECPAIYAGYLIRVKCGVLLLPDYLNCCLGSPAGKEYCWQVKSDGVSQSNINAKKLAAFEFGLPSVKEQTEIVRRVETLFAFADRLEARLKTAQTAADRLTPALLAKAFRGELVPQDPNDEPVAELLKRLTTSRDAAPKAKRGRRSATA